MPPMEPKEDIIELLDVLNRDKASLFASLCGSAQVSFSVTRYEGAARSTGRERVRIELLRAVSLSAMAANLGVFLLSTTRRGSQESLASEAARCQACRISKMYRFAGEHIFRSSSTAVCPSGRRHAVSRQVVRGRSSRR